MPTDPAAGPEHPFLNLMWRYVNRYSNCHDLAICDELMVPEYTLYLGPHTMAGRDNAYKPASGGEFARMPDLHLSVRKIITNGDQIAMHFVEHGASPRFDGNLSTWDCVALYRWNGSQLTTCYVEEDYYARRRQLKSGVPNPVGEVAIAPFSTVPQPPDAAAEAVVRDWIAANPLVPREGVVCDDSWCNGWAEPAFRSVEDIEIREFFSCGNEVAFSTRIAGTLEGGLPDLEPHIGRRAEIVVDGIATVAGGRVETAAMVTDRLEMVWALERS